MGENPPNLPAAAPVYRVAGVEIDVARASVSRAGVPVPIRPKTYRMLLFLLLRADRMVTKEELIEGVWEGTAVSDDVLVRSIAELRKVFADDPKNPRIIRTYPKLGYGITVPPVETLPPPPAARSPRARWWMLAGVLAVGVGAAVLLWRNSAPEEPPFLEAAWWKLNEPGERAALDSSQFHRKGTVAGSVRQVDGRTGKALELISYDAAIHGTGPLLPNAAAPRTLSAWVKVALPQLNQEAVFDYGDPAPGGSHFALVLNEDGRISSGFSRESQLVTAHRWNDGAWHLVTVVYEGTESGIARLFVDGRQEATAKLAAPSPSTASEWRIGGGLNGGGPFRGALADVRFYAWAMNQQKVEALYRCATGASDSGAYYFMPIFADGVRVEERTTGELSASLHNPAKDFSGAYFAPRDSTCGLSKLYAAKLGGDVRISADVLVPADGANLTEAGPCLRSRRGMGGDGIIGGESAGYWVAVFSNGMVTVRCLNPWLPVAYSEADPSFDSTVFHYLEAEARSDVLRVRLDGRLVTFHVGSGTADLVHLPALWERLAAGKDQGAAGIAFAATRNRGMAGGQRARNIQVTALSAAR